MQETLSFASTKLLSVRKELRPLVKLGRQLEKKKGVRASYACRYLREYLAALAAWPLSGETMEASASRYAEDFRGEALAAFGSALLAEMKTRVTRALTCAGMFRQYLREPLITKETDDALLSLLGNVLQAIDLAALMPPKEAKPETPTATTQKAEPATRSRIVLVGCGKSKLPHSTHAKELYTGQLFKFRRHYAETSAACWFILSAKHGLLSPESIVSPYDQRLRASDAGAWGAGVMSCLTAQLAARGISLANADLEVHAGRDYADGLISAASANVFSQSPPPQIVCPTKGLGIGEQLAFYKRLFSAN